MVLCLLVCFWTSFPADFCCPPTGNRGRRAIVLLKRASKSLQLCMRLCIHVKLKTKLKWFRICCISTKNSSDLKVNSTNHGKPLPWTYPYSYICSSNEHRVGADAQQHPAVTRVAPLLASCSSSGLARASQQAPGFAWPWVWGGGAGAAPAVTWVQSSVREKGLAWIDKSRVPVLFFSSTMVSEIEPWFNFVFLPF